MPKPIWLNWVDHRRALKKPLTENSAQLCISQLDGFRADGHDPVGVVNASIMNGWQGLFPPRAAPRHANGHVNGHAKPSYSDEIQTAMARAMHNVRGADHDEIPS